MLIAMRISKFALISIALLFSAACAKKEDAPSSSAQSSAATKSSSEPAQSSSAEEGSLLNPPAKDYRAPDKFAVNFKTTKGDVIIDVERALSPHGADRIYTLVKLGYFEDVAFFRVISGFMAQVGIHGDPAVNAAHRNRNMPDDPVKAPNVRGAVSFAKSGLPNSRSTQFFINFADNTRLDPMGFAPFGKVRDMSVVDAIYAGYGEGAPAGRGPEQGMIQLRGNDYLKQEFPELDYIVSASIEE